MSEPKLIVRLTRTEQLALLNVLIEHWEGCENVREVFIDPITGQRVNYGDLLVLFVRMDGDNGEPPAEGEGDEQG